MFSEFPFEERSGWYTFIEASSQVIYDGGKETKEFTIKRSDYPNIKDAAIEITEIKKGLPPKKVINFNWNNPDVKVKINENEGTLNVFVDKKKRPGAYVKVFSKKNIISYFYRDGYTDMTGAFRYAMNDL